MKSKTIISAVLLLFVALGTNAHTSFKKGSVKIKHLSSRKVYAMDDLVKNLKYGFAKSAVSEDEYDRLDQLAEVVIEKNYAIALRGYADAIGTYTGNWIVSQKRCNAVKEYLIKKGVPARLIVSTAFGSTYPVATNLTKAGRSKNRRVEIKLQHIEV